MSNSDRAHVRRVLAIGVYLSDQRNLAVTISRELASAKRYDVEQRWMAIGGLSNDPLLRSCTAGSVDHRIPKFVLLEQLLAEVQTDLFDFVLLIDDDAELAPRFVDRFLELQERFDFALAQPARTADSHIELPIVERHPGLVARETLFVEQGPVASFHRSAFALLRPFETESPMGWGLENVWSLRLAEAGLRLGIIDAVPVGHRLRPPLANYAWNVANEGRELLFASTRHRPTADCFRVLRAYPAEEA